MKCFAVGIVAALSLASVRMDAAVSGWLTWRGPLSTSVSLETDLPVKLEGVTPAWTAEFPGQSTPVIADGRLYINGYTGEGAALQEGVRCYDANTGKLLWEHRESDFLSDTIYLRYSTSSPTIDPETGNVYVQFTQGLFAGFTAEGRLLWKHSMMEEFGRLTFPNSRTATPVVDGELVITRGITSAWGAHGPAGDRFYAFDKKTGELVWSAAPGDRPQDNTFSNPFLDFWNGKRVLYSAGGDSSILALNARTGEPLWRFSFAKAGAKGGINASLIRYQDTLIAVHDSENLDSSEIGRMAAFRIPAPAEVKPTNATSPAVFTFKDLEVWRNNVGSLASSPVLVGDTIYEVSGTGDLAAVDARTGKVLWKKKLAIEQRQSTPFYANGYLYVAMYIAAEGADAAAKSDEDAGGRGDLWVLKPGPDGAEVVSHLPLDGRCYGSPVGFNGRLYLQTDKKLYAWGKPAARLASSPPAAAWPSPGPVAQLQIIPYEVLLRPGQTQSFRIRALDANGFTVSESVDPATCRWEPFIPPTALVRATMKASVNAAGQLVADAAPVGSGGQFKATWKTPDGREVAGYLKGRILPYLPVKFDFEEFDLSNTTTNTVEPPTAFAYPPLPWNSARFRFEVRNQADASGAASKALVKTIENKLFQRGQIFFGFPTATNYTIEADVLSEGNRRKMSEVGLINQRYAVILKGNSQELEVNSNQERLKVAAPFKWSPNTWYRLKVRVDGNPDGGGVVRGKAWKRGDPEPEAWTTEVPVPRVHTQGSPGLFGFAPQEMRVAFDNITVTPN
ncbi:MAG: PQQ-binding-like beta-propeller repeat protein [Verrucomicrobia bacterium]|nr:PQQ-binding-like beta-propeller repeat protein [Verrucomicrobiota bacterium]